MSGLPQKGYSAQVGLPGKFSLPDDFKALRQAPPRGRALAPPFRAALKPGYIPATSVCDDLSIQVPRRMPEYRHHDREADE